MIRSSLKRSAPSHKPKSADSAARRPRAHLPGKNGAAIAEPSADEDDADAAAAEFDESADEDHAGDEQAGDDRSAEDNGAVLEPSGNGAKSSRRRRATAHSMAADQRDISVSEFFAKNRHLLGFDNPRKALLTTVKEAVDNSLDACEEAGILPEVWVHIQTTGPNCFKIGVQDNGPGILKKQIPLIFGKLLYGSKFHRLRMSRGQQGIGISAAGMYGVLTTGKPVKIISKISKRAPAHYYEIQIDTKKNKPEILNGRGDGVEIPSGDKGRAIHRRSRHRMDRGQRQGAGSRSRHPRDHRTRGPLSTGARQRR